MLERTKDENAPQDHSVCYHPCGRRRFPDHLVAWSLAPPQARKRYELRSAPLSDRTTPPLPEGFPPSWVEFSTRWRRQLLLDGVVPTEARLAVIFAIDSLQ